MRIKIGQVKKELLADEEFRRKYDALEEEFSISAQLIEARTEANLTQEQVARRMGTTQSVVARLELGHPLSADAEAVCVGDGEQGGDQAGERVIGPDPLPANFARENRPITCF